MSYLSYKGLALRDNGLNRTFCTLGAKYPETLKFADCASWHNTNKGRPASDVNWSYVWEGWQKLLPEEDYKGFQALMRLPSAD